MHTCVIFSHSSPRVRLVLCARLASPPFAYNTQEITPILQAILSIKGEENRKSAMCPPSWRSFEFFFFQLVWYTKGWSFSISTQTMYLRSAFLRSAFSRSVFSRSAVCDLRFRGLCFQDTRQWNSFWLLLLTPHWPPSEPWQRTKAKRQKPLLD